MRIGAYTLILSGVFSYCVGARADTISPVFINNTGGPVTDLHVTIQPFGIKITNPPSANDRTSGDQRLDRETHNWYGLTLKAGDQVKPTFESPANKRIKIAEWHWTTGGDAGFDGDIVGDTMTQADLKLSFAPGQAVGDGAVAIHSFGQDFLFNTTAGSSASDSAKLLSSYLQQILFADNLAFYLPTITDPNSVEFLPMILDDGPTYAAIVRQDSGQAITVTDLNVPEPVPFYLTGFGVAVLGVRNGIRRLCSRVSSTPPSHSE
jgi:hypothetical protein